ncbi:MAG: LysR family transcriptional regulator [Oscillospiraceae bacterium]|nr:LysR family transcriptional regulator [Oscillospiraceae bacterium]
MDLQSLNIFVQAAELNSFTKAGELLGYSQPTVSFQIKQLEKELGVQLFDRIGHTINLTDAGRKTLMYAQQMIHISREMLTVEDKDISGKVRIAMADSLCSPLIADSFSYFRSKYPNISFEIKTAGTGDLFKLLDHNEADIVCTLDTPIYNTLYKIVSEEKIGVHFIVSKNSELAGKEILTISELTSQPFMLTEKGMSYRRLLDEYMARHSAEIFPVLEISSPEIICRLVEDNQGISFLPDYVTENAVKEGKIVRLEAEGYSGEVWKQIIYHRDKWVSEAMKVTMEHLSSVMLV